MTAYEHILLDQDGPIAYLTMNRPDKRNALSLEHMLELTQALGDIGTDLSTQVVVLRANGPAFCAGHDIGEMHARSTADYERIFETCTRLMMSIRQIPQPVIAQVHAIATAAGCQLAATCDLVVAAHEATFATPGVRIGLFCSTPMVALSRAVGAKKSMEMLLTGQPMSAQEAMAAGLVNRVVPADELGAQVSALATHIAQASPAVIGLGKQAFYRQLPLPIEQAYAYAQGVMVANAGMADAQEGMDAFLTKRPPVWTG